MFCYSISSYDEMAANDLQSMVDVALAKSNASQLYYVGHSQGTIVMFSKLATDAAFNQKAQSLNLNLFFVNRFANFLPWLRSLRSSTSRGCCNCWPQTCTIHFW